MSGVVFFESPQHSRNVLCDTRGQPIRFFSAELGFVWFRRHIDLFDVTFTEQMLKRLTTGGMGGYEAGAEDPMRTFDVEWHPCQLKAGARISPKYLAIDGEGQIAKLRRVVRVLRLIFVPIL
jgi:hypothetical protein